MKIAVVGVGNRIVKDDGVGIFAAELLRKEKLPENVDILESERGGIYLLDLLEGYDKAFIIDAVITETGIPGEIYKTTLEEYQYQPKPNSLHTVDIMTALKLYRQENIKVPDDIVIFSVEVKNIEEFGEGLTHEVEKGTRELVKIILDELK